MCFRSVLTLQPSPKSSALNEVRGTTLDNFISEAQDRQKNALSKSVQAAFLSWQEQLQNDQIQFEQASILSFAAKIWQGFFARLGIATLP